ncbi:MAG: cell division protein FtsL [Deltaproteobacteria bacterium]|nr:cell division protein FtsL [Deltaproteobacteria bacterium]
MNQRRFLFLWSLAVIASSAAFIVHLALRGKTVDVGFQLGRVRDEQARLREVKRVLELEATSYQTPKRVEMVARTLLGMTPPAPEKVIALKTTVAPEKPKAAPVAAAEPAP